MISPSFPDWRPYEVDSKNNVSTLQKSCLWQSEFGRDQECFSLFQNVNHVQKLDSKWWEWEYAGIDSKNNKVDWPNLKGNTPQESFINPYEKLKGNNEDLFKI